MICFECGKPAFDKHHVVPKSLGGTKTVPLCPDCHGMVHGINRVKSHRLQMEGIRKAKESGVYFGRREGACKVTDNLKTEAIGLVRSGMTVGNAAAEIGVSRRTLQRYMKELK